MDALTASKMCSFVYTTIQNLGSAYEENRAVKMLLDISM